MAKAKLSQAKQYAYEEFMRRAEKEKRVRREEISMKALKPDTSLQARVDNINTEHVRNLHELLKNGQELAPIVVFEIAPGKLKIADGFHRHEVYRREKRLAIPCLVITGTLQEAVEYAASCNQVLSLPRKREDIKKAIYMLLENGWFEKSAPLIASQVGTSYQTVNKYRATYCVERNLKVPDTIVDVFGHVKRKRRKLDDPYRLFVREKTNGREFRVNVGSKSIYLGADEKEAKSKLAALNADRLENISRASTATKFTSLPQACASRGVGLLSITPGDDTRLIQIKGHRTPTAAVSVWEDGRPVDLLKSLAETLLIAAHFGLERKVVVKKQDDHGFAGIIEVAGKLGVEFMTLDEFVASEKDAAQ